jgi:hypothetical protein
MRYVILSLTLIWCISSANAQTNGVPKDSVTFAAALIGEWQFVHVLGPDGKPTDHIERDQGPTGQTMRVQAYGPDMTIRADGSYEKRFTPKNKDIGYWSLGPSAVIYTMVIPMTTEQGNMLRMASQMFNKELRTDGKGNYLDSSTAHLIGLTADEMHVLEDGYTFVYRKR